jgi:alkylation response protein AidB-like acyl-CoA dehydrogenase
MDFDLNQEQKMLQQAAKGFLKKECPKTLVRELDDSDQGYSPELWQKMADLGWMGLVVPEEYGGVGLSFLDLTVLLGEMGYNLCPGPFFATVVLGAMPIAAAGSDEQKANLLPRVASGELRLTMAIPGPSGRYDPALLDVEAVAEGDEYVLSGSKLFVPDAHVAQHILCVARTTAAADPSEGVTVFLVETDRPGLQTTLLKTISRDKQCEVVFDRVRVPKTNVVGIVDRGWEVVRETLQWAAVARCAETLGSAQAAADMALQYAEERAQFGRPIGTFQAVQHHLANMWVAIMGSRYLVNKAAWKLSDGLPADLDVAMAKARVGAAGRQVTSLAHQLFGGIGFTMEHDVHLYHRRTLIGDLAFGGTDVQLENVAQALGL